MKRLIKATVGILVVLLAGTVQAELQLVADFEGLTGNPDGQACNGVLGGTLDTNTEGTGNSSLPALDGSTTMSVIGHSSATIDRAIGFGGIDNPIEDGETGIGFFRLRVSGGNIRTHMGLVADTTGNPVNATNNLDPATVPAGFQLVPNGAGFDIVTLDGTTVLKAGLATAQWYNIWIVADHAADTFDLYLSKAAGPAGEATLPAPGDLVERGVPFAVATTDPLNGMIFANPRGTGQAARIHVDEIWWDGDQGLSKPTMARNPNPADQQQDVPRDVILSWIPAPSAVMHNIYFGTGPDSIALVADGQETNTFDPGGPLEFNRTYYWRIDEVNTAPDFTVFEGSLWSFTVEPVSYPIPNVTATASSASENMGPERTVDGSGLQGDQHSTEPPRMWLSANGGPQPTWIQYSFGTAHKLDQLLVWNSNQLLEPILGFGAKAVTVEHSLDGAAWTTLGDFEFARAAGREAYTANTAVDFSGAVAKHVRLTIHSNWGGVLPQYGLSEVRFFYLPVLPRQPLPAAGQTTVAVDAMLSWRAGREAASHQVQLSTDQQAVIDGAAPMQTVVENSFDPGPLDLGSTYFWKVTEVNDAETPAAWEGEVWSFTTREYLAIEDFESYNDDDNRIYDTWIDGLTTGASGSQVGYDVSPFAERLTVHSGKQSMPLHYDNTASPFFSETERTFASPQNWTTNAADTFTLYVRGRSEGNTPDLLYVTVQDSGNRTATAIHPDPLIVTTGQWTPWSIPLSVFTSEGVRADNIKKLIIGVGDRTQSTPGGAGLLYIDSVSFGRPASQ